MCFGLNSSSIHFKGTLFFKAAGLVVIKVDLCTLVPGDEVSASHPSLCVVRVEERQWEGQRDLGRT